jgi:deazaflavin-dependent oxidoreductase (nitroreductase family)
MAEDRELTFNERNIADFRESGGKIAAFGDGPVLLLGTVGAKSGQRRTNPLMYLADDDSPDRVYIFASAAGADRDPAWFRNVVAHPSDVKVEIGTEHLTAEAKVVPDPQRAEIYARQAARYPAFAGYQETTSRPIPVVELDLHRSR